MEYSLVIPIIVTFKIACSSRCGAPRLKIEVGFSRILSYAAAMVTIIFIWSIFIGGGFGDIVIYYLGLHRLVVKYSPQQVEYQGVR